MHFSVLSSGRPFRRCCFDIASGSLNLVAISLIIIAGTVLPAVAADAHLRLSEYQKQDWQVEDGLPENNVRMIAQQPDGRLLVATASGLATFDGLHFQSLSLPGGIDNEAVNAVLLARNGDMWVGTDGRGVLHYSGSAPPANISELAGFMNERIRMLYEDAAGNIWIATQNGIEWYRDGKLNVLGNVGMISGDVTTPFAEDEHGGMFFITAKGLFHLINNRSKPYFLRDRSMGTPVAVYRDLHHRLWVGTMKGIVQLTPREDGQGYDEIEAARIKSPVTVLVGDLQGNLWIGTRHDGIWRLDADGVSSWNSHNGLADDAIRSLFVDSDQNLWAGMLTGGLSRWRKAAFVPFGETEDFPETYAANVLSDSRGDLWLGTWGKGLYRLHNGKLANLTPSGMPVTTPVRALAEDRRGMLWVGTWFDGLYRYDGQGFRHYMLGIESPGNAVSSLLFDQHGGLWVGTYTGLLHFSSGEPAGRRSSFLDSKLITCMLEDTDGSILVGTSSGMFRIRDGFVSPIANLSGAHVLSITRDSLGYTWIGTQSGGLALLRNDRAEPLNIRSGLPPLSVRAAVEDGNGYLWMGTSRGIDRVSVAALHAVADGKDPQLAPVLFGRADGMRSSECSGPSLPGAARAADGTLWFATTKGFVHTTDIVSTLTSDKPVVPSVTWTFNDDLNAAHSSSGERINVEAGQSELTFLFNVINLSNPSQTEFRYRLVGYDAGWTITHSRLARYRRLPPGKYILEVQARNGGEAWGASAISLSIKQKAYFYQSWYFYLAILLLGAVITTQLFRQRVRLVKGQIGIVIEERNRIAREWHDTLMAGFSAVSWQLEATAKILQESALTDAAAVKSCELARSMVSHCQAEARRIIWDLRDSEEMTSTLSRALSRTLDPHQSSGSTMLSFRVEGDEVPLAPAYVHHLVCIGQEAVSNAMRHASPSHIAVCLRYESDSLSLSIRDDGCGFRAATSKVGHFGIPVMEERARKVGGLLRLQTSHGEGTEVAVHVSFKEMKKITHQRQLHVVPWIGI